MGWLREESAYERRIRELDEEADRVRKNMQALMKSGTREASARSPAPTGPRTRSSAIPGQLNDVIEEETQPFELEESDRPEEPTVSASDPRRGSYNQAEYERTTTARKPEKLASYLASGSFGKAGSLSRERRIQRNKAIFMLIVALLAIFSLISWLR
jgi:hypothetical protein